MDFMFFVNSIMLGFGLAMDAFSVSLANGMNEPKMSKSKSVGISSVFAFFQAFMPLIGWVCVRFVAQKFKLFEKCVPYVALILLLFIGGKMLLDGFKQGEESDDKTKLSFWIIIVQGIATSIDALSVGFTIEKYQFLTALISTLIIALVTFTVCLIGVFIGKKFGDKLSNKAQILGGIILILIGLEIFVTGIGLINI